MAVKVHVNQLVIRANKKTGANDPPLSIIRGRTVTRAHEVQLVGAAKIVYSPDKPLKCGAKVWVECDDAEILK